MFHVSPVSSYQNHFEREREREKAKERKKEITPGKIEGAFPLKDYRGSGGEEGRRCGDTCEKKEEEAGLRGFSIPM